MCSLGLTVSESAREHGLPSRLTGRPSAVRNDCASLTLPTDRCVRPGLMDLDAGRSSDVDFILRRVLGWGPAEDLTVTCACSCVLTSLKGCGTWPGVVAAAGSPY